MNLLTEYMTLKQKEETLGITLPKPVYLFIEHYGRSLSDELAKLAEAFGYQDYFSFSTDNLASDSNLYQSFYSQMQQAAPTGREFQGCILISLSDRIQEHDFTALVTLIKNTPGILPIFTQKSDADIGPLLPILKNHFFLRVVDGEPYSPDEQFQIAREELIRCGFTITPQAEQQLRETLTRCNWQKNDSVSHKLKTIVQNLAYNKLMDNADYTLLHEDITGNFNIKPEGKKSFPIGFSYNG